MRELGSFLPDGVSYGIVQPGPHIPNGVPIVRAGDVSRGGIRWQDPLRVDPAIAARFSRTELAGGELLLTVVGSPGQSAIAPAKLAGWNVARAVAVLRPHGLDVRWLHYYLGTDSMQGQIHSRENTTVQATLNLEDVKRLQIPDLPFAEQQAIAEVLGALDDKIAANYTLATKSDGLIRALFVATSQSSDERTIDSICASPRHHVHPSRATGFYVGLEHLPRRHMWLHERGDAAEVASAKSSFERGDVLFGKLRPYFHKVVSAPASGICSTDILVLRAKDPALQGFILAAASSDSVVASATASSAGTKMPRTSWSDLRACTVPWPEEAGALELSARVMELREATEAAVRESRTLATLRDTLLPALMDGTLRVKDAIAQAEEVL